MKCAGKRTQEGEENALKRPWRAQDEQGNVKATFSRDVITLDSYELSPQALSDIRRILEKDYKSRSDCDIVFDIDKIIVSVNVIKEPKRREA